MKIFLRVWLIFILFMVTCSSPLSAEQKSYSALGSGPTERAAIQDAFRKILENAQGIDVESNSYLTNSMIDRDNIHSYTNGHIESYTVLDSHFDGTVYNVEVEANVAPGEGPASPQAARSTEHLGISDLIIGLNVNAAGNRSALYGVKNDQTIEANITNHLTDAGFAHIFSANDINAGPFDYTISGTLTSRAMPMNLSTDIPLYTNQAVLSIRVTRCDTGESLLTGEYLGSSIDISKQNAETTAKCVASNKAAEAIVSVLRNVAVNAQKSYTITVHNVKDYHQLTALKDYLSYACNAENVVIKTFDENNAVLTLNFTGENDDLADMLSQNPSYSTVITKITTSTIELTY
ncbi:LPP20 family lipoprotein [Pectinatus frisingensis]|uniref:LPP20 family lipoprotein n=1 Tax=Pectinatus frisingensis TaxID=865 RepID=UPI0018C7559E|nr:LPP20 family lipoprotein [Pectinatus frisingensis]